MDKKTISGILAAVGAGAAILIVYLFFLGGFTKGQVHHDPNGVEKAQGNVAQTAQNYNALGFRLINSGEDMCISPNMLASNIGLYAYGAVDEGKEQAEMMLGAFENLKENHAALVNELDAPTQDSFFTGLFMDKKTKPKNEFVQANRYFGTYFETLDFYDFVAVRDKINSIASTKTKGQITQAINEIYAKDAMIFVSALNVKEYFTNDVGSVTFEEKDFMGNSISYYSIDKAKVLFYEDDRAIFVRLPLENGYDYEIIMAKNGDLTGMTLADIKQYRDSAKETVISISMPSPKLEGYFELEDKLKAVGFDAPFNKTTLIKNINNSIKMKVDKMDQSISFELLKKETANNISGDIVNNVYINKSYYYMLSHRKTGCKTIMGRKTK